MPVGDGLRGKKPTNTPKGPAPKAVVESRITQVVQYLIRGYRRYQIIELMKDHNLSNAGIDEYIKKATELRRVKNEKTIEDDIRDTEEQIEDIYQGAIEEKKYGDAARAIKLKMELKGLEAPKKIKIIPLSDEDRQKVDDLINDNIYD